MQDCPEVLLLNMFDKFDVVYHCITVKTMSL